LQYDEHLTQLENNILLVQKRAMEQADDSSWLGPDEENYTIAEPEFRGVMIAILIFNICDTIFFIYLIQFLLYLIHDIKIYFQSQTSSPENPFGKSNIDDFDFVDVEGDMEAEDRNSKKKDVLEEGNTIYDIYIYI